MLPLMDLVYFVLCAAGLTNLLTISKILAPVRPKHHFFHCQMCVGFWVGLLFWAVNGWTSLFTFNYEPVTAFALACLSSATSYWLGSIFGDDGIRYERKT
jgi:hypothetical protein